jgi:PmbA protein
MTAAARKTPPAADPRNLLEDLVRRARKAGADGADAVLFQSASLSLSQRLGNPEKLEREESRDLGLRVFVGKRQAIVSTTDISAPMLNELVARSVAMARSVPEDPHCGLADPAELVRDYPTLDICDPVEPATAVLRERARAAEDAARAVKGITNSEGADAGWGRSAVALVASNGFAGSFETSHHGLSVSVLAGEGTGMERDYDYVTAVHGSDLEDGAEVGRRAGERAVRRLNPRKAATAKVPVIYDPRVANSLLGHLAGAINGAAIARGTSFLKDKLNQRIFGNDVSIVDDPHRPRGLRSKPFDGEGLANRRRSLIDKGTLTGWVLDLRSARQLGLKSTGNATRGTSSPPSPALTNLYMEPGKQTPKEMIGGVLNGFYVTELIGMGVNGVTGDYSRGAGGYWIEHGELAYPVSEVTIAGNLTDMFLNLTPANDLVFRYGADAPTLRVDGMTVAGV